MFFLKGHCLLRTIGLFSSDICRGLHYGNMLILENKCASEVTINKRFYCFKCFRSLGGLSNQYSAMSFQIICFFLCFYLGDTHGGLTLEGQRRFNDNEKELKMARNITSVCRCACKTFSNHSASKP